MNFLEAEDLHKSYRTGETEREVLEGLDLSVKEGELSLIIGPSGSGKTTLLNILGGIDRADSGEIKIEERELSKASDEELRKHRAEYVGFIFQFYNLMPTLSARENVELGCEVKDWSKKKVIKESKRYLTKVGLKEETDKFPQQLSGGQQQRVAIARALAKHPKMILGDEPTGNLDEETSMEIIELLRDVNKRFGTTMVIVSHDRALRDYADDIYELRHGRLNEV